MLQAYVFLATWSPFTHAVEAIRFALFYDQVAVQSLAIVGGCLAFFLLTALGYDPQRDMLLRTSKPG